MTIRQKWPSVVWMILISNFKRKIPAKKLLEIRKKFIRPFLQCRNGSSIHSGSY